MITAILLAMMLAALDSSIVNTALPRMVAELGGLAHLSWVVTGFMLSSTITSPLYGKLSDSFGRRDMFAVAILIFMAGSALCGAAQSMDELIAFRALQGLGAGGLLVLAQAAIGDVVSPRDRPRYQGLFTAVFGLCSVAGPVLGGLITQELTWRWIFYVNLPIGAAALAMMWVGMPRARPEAAPGRAGRVDYTGSALLAGLTASLLLLLAGGGNQFAWVSAQSAGLVAVSLVSLALFIWNESVAREPLIRLALFRNAIFARGTAVGGMVMFAMFGALVFTPLYFQLVFGMSPARSGLMILPQVGCMMCSSILGGRIISRLGRYHPFLLAGVGLEAFSLALLAVLAYVAAPPLLFVLAMGTLGLGMGMGMPNLTNAVQNAVAHSELGAATGAMVFIRSLGGAVGVAASGAIMTARLGDIHALTAHGILGLAPAARVALAHAYRNALSGSFTLSAVVIAAAFGLLLGLPERRLRKEIDA